MTTKSVPSWWPLANEIVTLDVRDDLCRVSVLDKSTGQVILLSEPAVLRRDGKGAFSHWGRRALAWKDRLLEGQVCQVFPSGHPIDPTVSRWYLRRFIDTYLPGKASLRTYVVESRAVPWLRQLWRETLEDSALTLQGFLTPWQQELLLAKGSQVEQALSPYLYFRVDDSRTSWVLINGGNAVEEGGDPGLSEGRLVGHIGDFLRRLAFIEVAPPALRALLAGSCRQGMARPDDLTHTVAGRHLLSGLPTQASFSWPAFVATQSSLVLAWQDIKRSIYSQVEQVSGSRACDEGLDIPGWRVLTSDSVSALFVEGPVVRLFEQA
jgi:hypothetical protein